MDTSGLCLEVLHAISKLGVEQSIVKLFMGSSEARSVLR